MKKIICLLIVLAVVMSFSACRPGTTTGTTATAEPDVTATTDPGSSLSPLADITALGDFDYMAGLGTGAAEMFVLGKISGVNFETRSNIIIHGDYMYFMDGNEDNLLKRLKTDSITATKPETILGTATNQFFIKDDKLYASVSPTTTTSVIVKIDLTAGANLAKVTFDTGVLKNNPSNIKLAGDKIYFSYKTISAKPEQGIAYCDLNGGSVETIDSGITESATSEIVFPNFVIDRNNSNDVYYQKGKNLMKYSSDDKSIKAVENLDGIYGTAYDATKSFQVILDISEDYMVYLNNKYSDAQYGAVLYKTEDGTVTTTGVNKSDYRYFWTIINNHIFVSNDFALTRYTIGTGDTARVIKGHVAKTYLVGDSIYIYSISGTYGFYKTNRNGENLQQITAVEFYTKMGDSGAYVY